jgi:hypothetical protein
MATQYFFAHGDTQHGPYSALEMQGLAVAGKIEQTDTVWREGIGQPIPAARVKHLFPNLEGAPAADAAPVEDAEPAPSPAFTPPAEKAPPRMAEMDRPRRVVSIKGGIVVSQDGRIVQYRKKCTICGHEDPARSRAIIRPGSMTVSFYCRKCRKSRAVAMTAIT